jgi:ABC-type multidrug transport system fused ATPase/permease subunit
LLGAGSLRAGRFTVGDLALFITYLQFLADVVALLGVLLVRLRRADVAMDRVAALVPGSEHAVVERLEVLETVVGPRGVRLSGGQVQRVAAARAFVRGADLLVFDDLSSALDVDTERELWRRVFTDPAVTVLAVSGGAAASRPGGRA